MEFTGSFLFLNCIPDILEICTGQVIPDTFSLEFSDSTGDRPPLAECNHSRF